ncbi:hypothetical protein Tcan_15199 [Toxocara canis]|uniref:Uncharacterized protein n=1 Tax=Toxocara canis TaxID=6265 RepID=A0A0B2UQT9_TOXCA|nr:hypothetical protein Tcan_15199 [Toxocara canis]
MVESNQESNPGLPAREAGDLPLAARTFTGLTDGVCGSRVFDLQASRMGYVILEYGPSCTTDKICDPGFTDEVCGSRVLHHQAWRMNCVVVE